ncbi:MAG: NusA-like transcription termination signal-binding factor [Euryarchaeota archaeon]|nr:NusA-like transcription termination signal-binding factor [Euryarchaeota archaeon]
MQREIGFKERRYIEELRILTKATALDCIIDPRFERIIYVIKKGDMGFAIGKKGENIRRLEGVLGKKVEMVEYDDMIEGFLTNIFRPAQVIQFDRDDDSKKINTLVAKRTDVGIAIGKNGSTIEKARTLMKRFYGYEVAEILVQ